MITFTILPLTSMARGLLLAHQIRRFAFGKRNKEVSRVQVRRQPGQSVKAERLMLKINSWLNGSWSTSWVKDRVIRQRCKEFSGQTKSLVQCWLRVVMTNKSTSGKK